MESGRIEGDEKHAAALLAIEGINGSFSDTFENTKTPNFSLGLGKFSYWRTYKTIHALLQFQHWTNGSGRESMPQMLYQT